jgi:hypothetical protein
MAAGVVLGYLRYVLGFDSIQFRKGMDEAERALVAKQKSFIKQGEKLQSLGKNMAAFITLPLAGLAAAGIKEAHETAQAMGQVNAALTSMGPVAGKTAGELQKAANAFEGSSLFEADQILSKVTANMLTFGNVAGDNFDRAQQAAINLSARLGQDLQSSTIQVGKALNDPIKGLTSLARVGIQFTDQQKEQIKAMVAVGDAAGAQRIILGELERQFGGAAQAAQNADPFNKLTDAFKNMAEAVGTALTPAIKPLTETLVGILNSFTALSPETQKWLIIVGATAAALGPLVATLGTMMTLLAGVKTVVLFASGMTGLAAAEGAAATGAATAGLAVRGMLAAINPAVPIILAVLYAFQHWDEIKPIVQRMVTAVADNLRHNFKQTLEETKANIHSLADKFRWLRDVVVTHSYIPDMVTGVGAWMAKLPDLMLAPALAAT